MANLLLQRRKRVESGTGTSVPEIRVVGSNLKSPSLTDLPAPKQT